jgi:hypothetical protein
MSEAGTQQMADDGSPAAGARSFAERFVGALRLDGSVYEEVASDPNAIGQAAGVAAIAAIANSVVSASLEASGQAFLNALVVFAMWPVLALLAWGAGWLLKVSGDLGRVLRATGYAMAPMTLVVIGLVPNKWLVVGSSLVALALYLGAFVVSIRPALRVDTGRAALICMIAGLGFVFLFLFVKFLAYQ